MRIEAYLVESPLFAVQRAARRLEALSARALAADRLSFLEGMILATLFFEAPKPVKPSLLAETFATSRGNISHCLSGLEAKGLIQRKIDPADARVFLLALKPEGKKAALRVISAFDKLQKKFEREIGKSELAAALTTLRELEETFPNG
jgi:DNA-binding MarR family transcriptional regulator